MEGRSKNQKIGRKEKEKSWRRQEDKTKRRTTKNRKITIHLWPNLVRRWLRSSWWIRTRRNDRGSIRKERKDWRRRWITIKTVKNRGIIPVNERRGMMYSKK